MLFSVVPYARWRPGTLIWAMSINRVSPASRAFKVFGAERVPAEVLPFIIAVKMAGIILTERKITSFSENTPVFLNASRRAIPVDMGGAVTAMILALVLGKGQVPLSSPHRRRK